MMIIIIIIIIIIILIIIIIIIITINNKPENKINKSVIKKINFSLVKYEKTSRFSNPYCAIYR